MERPAFARCASYGALESRRSAEREGGSEIQDSRIPLRSMRATRNSQQPQLAQLAAQALGHFGGTGRGAVEVLGRVFHREITPTLEGTIRARFGEHQFAVEHDATTADAVLIDERPHGHDALAAQHFPADHPKERAAVA